jgi:hypothetical protein
MCAANVVGLTRSSGPGSNADLGFSGTGIRVAPRRWPGCSGRRKRRCSRTVVCRQWHPPAHEPKGRVRVKRHPRRAPGRVPLLFELPDWRPAGARHPSVSHKRRGGPQGPTRKDGNPSTRSGNRSREGEDVSARSQLRSSPRTRGSSLAGKGTNMDSRLRGNERREKAGPRGTHLPHSAGHPIWRPVRRLENKTARLTPARTCARARR